MTTRPSFAKFLSSVLTVLVLQGWSATASAEDQPTPAKDQAVAPAAEQPTPAAATAEPAPAKVAAAAAPAATVASEQAAAPRTDGQGGEPAPDPASVTEVGIERLPGSAYPEPQIRGLPYGSLWLTFHGLQWPYMPATAKGSRFVLGLSGWGWVDTSYVGFGPSANNPNIGQDNIKYWKQQSRLLLRVTPTYSLDDGWFVQGQAEMVATEDQTIARGETGGADTDDLWLRIGQWNKWDLQVGRFEGWEVFHLGMGLDQNTFERTGAVGTADPGIAYYGLTDNQFRTPGAAGNMAFHYYPLRILRVELLGMAGSLGRTPVVATRPVAVLDLGWLKLKGGVEYQRQTDQTVGLKDVKTSKGVGGAVQFIFEPHIELGLNAAQGTVWTVDKVANVDSSNSYTRTSFGGFANVSNGSAKHPLIFGVGGLYTHTEDQHDLGNGVVDKYWLFQGFAAIQYVALEQLYIKLVGGYSRGHWLTVGSPPIVFDDEMYSVRLRFSFYF